ncbi:MAG: PepSY-like domain-containing protein [Chitinophagales bacterium]|nr:PepSY-like domain-containing protein [Chitinophagales bacterium]MDW8428371.1 PepSY-like domain-containing protein [Chitinophagales bacterium]
MILLCAALVPALQLKAQQTISEQYIPEIVKQKFYNMYPEAKGAYWKQPMPGFLDVYFVYHKKKANATFLVSGDWVSTEFEIDIVELPATVRQYLDSQADKITRCYLVKTKASGTQYAADARAGGEYLSFVFDSTGNLIMKGPRD